MIKCFLTDYRVEGESFPEKNFFKIAQRYLKGEFLIDFIPLVPIPLMLNLHTFPDGKLFYLLKIVRLKRGLEVFNVQAWIRGLKEQKKEALIKKCEEHPEIGEDNINDHNGILTILPNSTGAIIKINLPKDVY